MKFIKYPSLTNDYALGSQRHILAQIDQLFYASEKLDGSNVSIILDDEDNIALAKRSGILKGKDDEKQFKPFIDFFEQYKEPIITQLKQLLIDNDAVQIHLYGEMYGAGIQKSKYTISQQGLTDVKFFNAIIMTKNDEAIMLSRQYLQRYLDKYLVPVKTIRPLRELIDIDIEKENSDYANDYFEGYVYMPFNQAINLSKDALPAIKHKTEKFQEVKKPRDRKKSNVSKSQLKLNLDVERYVTKQRIEHVLNNESIELKPQLISEIIHKTQADIEKEYVHENDTSQYDDTQIKQAIKATSRQIALTVKEMIKEQSDNLIKKEG